VLGIQIAKHTLGRRKAIGRVRACLGNGGVRYEKVNGPRKKGVEGLIRYPAHLHRGKVVGKKKKTKSEGAIS